MNNFTATMILMLVLCCIVVIFYKSYLSTETFDAQSSQQMDVVMSNSNGDLLRAKPADLFNIALPKGIIIAWSGETIPTGWALCDGNNGKSINNIVIPDLKDRFIHGKPQNKQLLETGGEAQHTLSVEEIPSHTHEFVPDRNIENNPSCECKSGACGCGGFVERDGSMSLMATGGGKPHNNMPPYMVLAFIIKVT